jgi:hypothetical protein
VELHKRLRSASPGDPTRDSLEHRVDSVEEEIDQHIRVLQARYRLLQASLRAEKATLGSPRSSLVARGTRKELEASLLETTDFRFLESLSRCIEVFPELDCASAPLKRNVLLDQLLERDGFEALLFRLPTEVAVRAGSAMGKALAKMVGDSGLDKIATGSVSLRDLDVGTVETAMREATGESLVLRSRSSRSPHLLPEPR